jgi:RNA polymerase sigma factor (sigma-70 family)
MAIRPAELLQHIRRLATPAVAAETAPDAALLERFVRHRDETAFAALVARQGPMVLRLCRRVLGDAHAAEDAFQATFLVLARKAGSIRRHEALAAWLYGVAYRVASRARRQLREVPTPDLAPASRSTDPLEGVTAREMLTILDEEVQRLPEVYRSPVILCCLEGQTQEAAAAQLGWTRGSLQGRLERGRARLRARLVRRGLTLSVGLLFVEASWASAGVALSPSLFASTIRGAVLVAGGQQAARAGVSAGAARLAEDTLRTMLLAKARIVGALLLMVGLLTGGAGLFAHQFVKAGQPGPQQNEGQALRQEAGGPAPDGPAQVRTDPLGDPLPPGALNRFGTLRLRQGSGASMVLFAPDGKSLASVGTTAAPVRFWDLSTGRLLREHGERRPGGQYGLAFAPDGKSFAVGDIDGQIHVWDVNTGKELRHFRGSSAQVSVLAYSPDGTRLAAASCLKRLPVNVIDSEGSHIIRLWNTADGKELRQLAGHTDWVNTLAFSPDGKTLVSGSDDKTVRCWDPDTGREKQQLRGHQGGVDSVAFSPDGKLLASAGEAEAIRLWEVGTGKEFKRLTHPASWVVFAPEGKTLASADREGARLWDVATGQEIRRFRTDAWGARSVAFSPDGRTLAATGNVIHLWHVATGEEILPRAGHFGGITSLAVAPTGRLVASAGSDCLIRLWEPLTGKEVRVLRGHPSAIRSLALSPDGGSLVSVSQEDGTIRLWDLATGRELRQFMGLDEKESVFLEPAISPDGKLLATAGSTLRVWDMATGKELHRLKGHELTSSVAFSPDGKTLATEGGHDRTIRLWDPAAGKERAHFQIPEGYFSCLTFSPDGRTLASGSPGVVRLWEIASGRERCQIAGPAVGIVSLAFSPSNRSLAAGGWDDNVHVWDTGMGKTLATLTGHEAAVWSVAFSPDGKLLVSGSQDTTALVWDATPWRPADAGAPMPLATDKFREAWERLAGADAPQAWQAIQTLCAVPGQTIPWLRERLRPQTGSVDRQRLRRLVADLDSDQFAIREKAMQELESLGEEAAPVLRETVAGQPSAEVRRRAEELLEKAAKPFLSGEQLQTGRAVEILERIGTPEAQEVLRNLATGRAAAWLTQTAKGSLERLARRSAAAP